MEERPRLAWRITRGCIGRLRVGQHRSRGWAIHRGGVRESSRNDQDERARRERVDDGPSPRPGGAPSSDTVPTGRRSGGSGSVRRRSARSQSAAVTSRWRVTVRPSVDVDLGEETLAHGAGEPLGLHHVAPRLPGARPVPAQGRSASAGASSSVSAHERARTSSTKVRQVERVVADDRIGVGRDALSLRIWDVGRPEEGGRHHGHALGEREAAARSVGGFARSRGAPGRTPARGGPRRPAPRGAGRWGRAAWGTGPHMPRAGASGGSPSPGRGGRRRCLLRGCRRRRRARGR